MGHVDDAIASGRFVEIEIEQAEIERLEKTMRDGKSLDGGKGKEPTYTWTAKFQDGTEVDVKVCDAEEEGGGAWSEAVLFDENGCELSCTEPDDTLAGDWYLFDGDDMYIVHVKAVSPELD